MSGHQRQVPPDLMMIYLTHAQQHIDAAKQNHQYMIAHAQEINQWAQKVALGLRQLNKAQQAQQQTGMVMHNMRGGPPPNMPAGVPPPGSPLPPPGPPQPGVTVGAPNPQNNGGQG